MKTKIAFAVILTTAGIIGDIVTADFEPIVIEQTKQEESIYDPCGLKVVTCDSHETTKEEVIQNTQEVKNNKHFTKEDIEQKIRETFPEDPDTAVAIAKCESGLIADSVGDQHLTFQHNGETLGSSHGLFMVRTGGNEGGKVWNRAAANNKTSLEFIAWMEDPQANIEYARDIYDGRGWTAWYNCAVKIGAI